MKVYSDKFKFNFIAQHITSFEHGVYSSVIELIDADGFNTKTRIKHYEYMTENPIMVLTKLIELMMADDTFIKHNTYE